MNKRKKIPKNIETEVLTKSRRRCCICFGINNDLDEKIGQIGHLDENRENNKFENLAWLCLVHHSLYDSTTSQHKNYTIQEVKEYRAKLYAELEQRNKGSDISRKTNEKTEKKIEIRNDKKNIDKEYDNLKNIISETITDLNSFKFNTKYDYNSNSLINTTNEIMGKGSVRIFVKQFHKILQNCVNKGRTLKKEHLDNAFTDGITENIIWLKIILETVLETNEFILNLSQTFKEKYFFLYDLKKYFKYILNNLLNNKKSLIEIEKELLPKAIELCKVVRMDILGLKEILNNIKEINIYLEKINKDYNWFLFNFSKNQEIDEANNVVLIDKAAILITKDIFKYLREFAKATTKNKLEIALPYLLYSTTIEDYVNRVTKQKITTIKHKDIDEVKKTLNNRGHSYKSTAHWPLVQNYERTKEGQIYFAITGDENKVFINAEGLELLNSYLAAFRKKTFQS